MNQSRNQWYDFGLGKGGDTVSLAMKLHGTDSVAYALNAIENNTPNLKPLSFSFRQRESFDSFEDITVKSLGNAALLQFLAERQIPASLARQSCQEVYYKHNGKPYFAIAFGNEQGGYDLRYKHFKGCFAPNRNLSNAIKELSTKIRTMEAEHKTAIDKLSEQLNKIFNYFPHIKELSCWEGFLKSIRLPDDMVCRLFNKETVIGSGELCSKEHSKRFKVENASLKLEQDKAKLENIRFTINGTDIFDWFKQKQKEFLNSLGINPKEKKGIKM